MRKHLLWVLFLSSPIAVVAQQPIDTLYSKYVSAVPPEKIHLHIDRNSYAAGETIFFKAYLQTAGSPSYISSNLYVDFYNDSGKLIQHTMWPIMAASARGNFDIPLKYAGERLHLKAYTQWMKNAGEAFFYQHQLNILPLVPTPKTIPTKANVSLQFFPEGGNWVYGLPANLAFKAILPNGLPTMVSGKIENQKGDSITDFSSWHDGMGTLFFTPEKGTTYQAVWASQDGTAYKTSLPMPLDKGATIIINHFDTALNYTIYKSDDAASVFDTIHVLATINQQIVYKANLKMVNQSVVSKQWNITDLPTGILQLTFFDAQWQPFAERIVMLNNENYSFNALVQMDTISTKPRGYNSIEVEVPVSYAANMSIAVTDANADEPAKKNIYTSMLLQGDLRGYIHNAANYFNDTTAQAKDRMDLVMLTNGWRKYNWQEIVAAQQPTIVFPAEQSYITLSGKIEELSKKQIQKINNLFLFAVGKDSSKNMFLVPLEKSGNFSLNGLIFFDTVLVYLRYNNKINNNYFEYSLNSNIVLQPDSLFAVPLQQFRLGDTTATTLARYLAEQQLKQEQNGKWNDLGTVKVKTTVKKTRIEELEEKYTSALFRSFDAYTFDVEKDANAIGANSVLFFIRGRVGGIRVGNDASGSPLITWRGAETSIYLNEVLTDAATLEGVSMNDVAYIKAFPPPFFGGQFGGIGGAIVVYTKRGSDSESPDRSPGMKRKTIVGFSTIKQFYSPDYATTNSTEKDVRTTLYWNPAVLTNSENRKLKLHFYNNDITRRFRIVLEGMNEDGKLIRVEKVVE
jgi:hypothetical protein